MKKAITFNILQPVFVNPYLFVLIVFGFVFEFFISFPYYITYFLDNFFKK